MPSAGSESPREKLEERLEKSKETYAQTAKEFNARDFEGRPQDGVRLFFPRIQRLFQSNIGYASGMAQEPASPSILQLLLLGVPILVDLRPDYASSAEIFQKKYGMSPDDFARESQYGDIIAIINDEDPLASWSDDALEFIQPIISRAQLEFAHFSLDTYFSWALGKRALDDIRDEGDRIFKDYFRCKDDEKETLAKALGYSAATDKVLRNVVRGRWRNIMSLKPGLADTLQEVFHELRDNSPADRAHVLNGMKHFVASSVTVGRGGVFRPSQTQIEQMQKTCEIVQEKEALDNIIRSDFGEGYWTAKVSDLLRDVGVVPAREVLDYDYYLELKKHSFAEEFGRRARELIATLAFESKESSIPQIEESLRDWHAVIAEEYEWAKRWQRPVEEYSGLFISVGLGVADAGAPSSTFFIREGVRSGIDRIASKGSVSKPGWQLHQIVRRAGKKAWLGDAAIATKKRDPDPET